MNPERWDRIQAIFEKALDRPPGERRGIAEAECGSDAALLEEVLALLEASPPDDFIKPPTPPGLEEAFALGLDGRELGDFQLVKEIGRGGMGIVYLARQGNRETPVALKLLPPVNAAGDGSVRFQREVSAASSLEHPAIVPVLGHGVSDGVAWYAMRFIEGHDLRGEVSLQKEHLAGQAKSETLFPLFADSMYLPTIAARIADIADGLEAAHSRGVVHRDLKPSNILLDQRGHAYLTDFGLAKDERFGTITDPDAMQGTPHYMSPEQARALKLKIDHRTDIYSLSVVLYEALTLKRPFNGTTPHEIVGQISRGTTTDVRSINSKIPRDLALICRKGMSRNPDDRYGTAEALAQDLRRFLRHEAVVAKAPGLRDHVAQWFGKRKRFLAAAAAVAVAALLGVKVASWSAERTRASNLAGALEEVLTEDGWDSNQSQLGALRDRLAGWNRDELQAHGELRTRAEAFEARLAQHRDSELARCRTAIQEGKGGQRGEPGFGVYQRPGSPRRLNEGMALAQRLAALFPNDDEVKELAAVEASFPTLGVTAVIVAPDGSERLPGPGEAEVFLAAIDPLYDTVGPDMSLGFAPMDPVPIAPGYYRIRVEVSSIGHADLIRDLTPSVEPVRAAARVHPRDQVLEGMVQIDGGPVGLPAPRSLGCLLLDGSSSVEAFHLEAVELSNERFLAFLKESGYPAPAMWKSLGFDGDWSSLPVAGFLDQWLKRPVTGITVADAQACAEWYGKRLPRHLELEHALSSVEPNLLLPEEDGDATSVRANLGGTTSRAVKTSDLGALYRHYLENTLPVDDPRCLQRAGSLFHAHGNLHEVTSSHLVRSVGGKILIDPDARVALGFDWEARAHGTDSNAHRWAHMSPSTFSFSTGVRLAY